MTKRELEERLNPFTDEIEIYVKGRTGPRRITEINYVILRDHDRFRAAIMLVPEVREE